MQFFTRFNQRQRDIGARHRYTGKHSYSPGIANDYQQVISNGMVSSAIWKKNIERSVFTSVYPVGFPKLHLTKNVIYLPLEKVMISRIPY